MMNFQRIVCLAILSFFFSGYQNAYSQETYDFRKQGPGVGSVFEYVTSKGGLQGWTMEDKLVFYDNKDRILTFNSDGNETQRVRVRYKPHNGIRPPNSNGELIVGTTWKQIFSKNKVKRTRKCRVESKSDLMLTHVVVKDAYMVKCTNQRADRELPMHEEIWFAPNVLPFIKYRARWYGSKPGEYGIELTNIKGVRLD